MEKKNRLKVAKTKTKIALSAFKQYIEEYAELEKEHARIPRYRMFQQMRNIKKRELLTRDFKRKMAELGIM